MPAARGFAIWLLAILVASAAEDSYRLDVEQDRKKTDELLRSPRSPLLLVGRFRVNEGSSAMGSDPASDFVLPSQAPRRVGTISRQGDQFSFQPASGIAVSLNGKPASGRINLQVAKSPQPSDRIAFGTFTFAIRPVGNQFELLLSDAQSQALKDFKGTTWFPIDPAYRLTAQFSPAEQSRTVAVALTDGASTTYTVKGDLIFHRGGQTLRLQALSSLDGKSLFVMFRDQTSGRQTYGGGRFLEVELPRDGKATLDFNRAYNPYCAYNPYAICPVPPRQNRLAVPIRAGETYTSRH